MRYVAVLCLILLSWLPPLQAREVAGVTVPDNVQLHADGSSLNLNGAGIRRKFFIDVYVGALYLTQPAQDLAGILALQGAKRISMQFVHNEVRAEKLVSAWNEGFENNLTAEEFRALRPRIANFNGLFPSLRKGDRVDIEIMPTGGTQVWINDALRGKVAGADFARALLHIWLGEHPADAGLKQALLGGD